MSALLLFIVVISWGLSWYAMALQLGEVPSLVSVAYRFLLAASLLTGLLVITRKFRPIPWRRHGLLAALGLCLFSMNFFCFYLGTAYMPSGVLSVIFATATIMGAFNQRLFFGVPLSGRVLLGAVLGIGGLALLSWDSIIEAQSAAAQGQGFLDRGLLMGIAIPLLGTYLFSLGNILSARLSRDYDLPNIVAHGMIYGALLCVALCLAFRLPFPLPSDAVYWGSLLYLAVMASVVAFLTYLSLVNREGPARAAYATVLFPIVAMLVSTVMEGFVWTAPAFLGVALALGGTVIVFAKLKSPLP